MIDWLLKKLRPMLCARGYHPFPLHEVRVWRGLLTGRLHVQYRCRSCKLEFFRTDWSVL